MSLYRCWMDKFVSDVSKFWIELEGLPVSLGHISQYAI